MKRAEAVSAARSRVVGGPGDGPTQRAAPLEWHVLTGEYPPSAGGVADYTRLVARGLAEGGDLVHVWHPESDGRADGSEGVTPHGLPGRFGRSARRAIDRALADGEPASRRIVLQWVPHGFGPRSLNVGLCAWLLRRRVVHGDHVAIMVHEPSLAFREGSWKQDAAAAVHRLMTAMLIGAAETVWVSTPAWARRWRPWALGRRIAMTWLPVPSNVPVARDDDAVARLRATLAPGRPLVGHFGTYGSHIAELLAPILVATLRDQPRARLLLLGGNGERMRDRLLREAPDAAERVIATGRLDAHALSLHLQACDVMVQPYSDGLSTRRGSAMATVAHGCAVVSTRERLTEPPWREAGAVRLLDSHEPATWSAAIAELLHDEGARASLGDAARRLYDARFDVRHTVAAMRAYGHGVPDRA